MTSLTPFLYLSPEDAPKAVELYTRVVPNCRVVSQDRFDNREMPQYSPDVWTLAVGDARLYVMGSVLGDEHGFTSSLSLMLPVADQAELDQVWDGFLAAGGEEMQCGWIKDPFGLQWQVTPKIWLDAMETDDHDRKQRMVEAIWQCTRIDVAKVEAAAQGE